MNQLESLVSSYQESKKPLFLRDISRSLNVHVSEAKRLLDDYVKKNRHVDKGFEPIYYVTGFENQDKSDELPKVHRLRIALQEEIESAKKEFSNIFSKQIRGLVIKNDPKRITSISSPAVLDKDELKAIQKLTFIINDEIEIRKDMAERYKLRMNGVIEHEPPIKEEYIQDDNSKDKKKREDDLSVKSEERNVKKMKVENESQPMKSFQGKGNKKGQVSITCFLKPKK